MIKLNKFADVFIVIISIVWYITSWTVKVLRGSEWIPVNADNYSYYKNFNNKNTIEENIVFVYPESSDKLIILNYCLWLCK